MMGFFNNLKSKSKRLAETLRDQPSSDGSDAPVVMEWDKIYVEIDNDANGTISNNSPTRGARGAIRQTESQTTYDHSKRTSFDDTTRNEGDDEDLDTPSVSNTQSRGDFTQLYSKSFSHMPSKSFSQMYSRTMTSGMLTRVSSDIETPDTNSQAGAFSITRDGKYLANNHFANAQLMRWKHAAEEGPCFIQYIVFFASLAAIFTTVYPLVIDDNHWTLPFGICAFHTITLCVLIIIFEFRVCCSRNPVSLRARIRSLLVRHLNALRLVWGRGFLYIFAGSMNVTMNYYPYNFITGGILIAAGMLSILMGAHAAFNLERLRLSLTDNSYLWNKFVKADTDQDNFIGIEDFSNLIWSLGLELDDSYTYRAFREIDHDHDGVINFYEFKLWWIASQDDETILTMETKNTMSTRRAMEMNRNSLATSRKSAIPDQISTNSDTSSDKLSRSTK